jgi:methylated-DNA-[protein]-cysteine S-methyltransferase
MADEMSAYWGTARFKEWILYLVATDAGLALITWPNKSFETVKEFAKNHLPGYVLTLASAKIEVYKDVLMNYLENGSADVAQLTLDLRGTDFQITVWRALLDIPVGQTATYREVANVIGRPEAVRAVAHAISANPIAFLIPCHRVIGKDGKLTGYRGGLKLKETLLQIEGVLAKKPEYYL